MTKQKYLIEELGGEGIPYQHRDEQDEAIKTAKALSKEHGTEVGIYISDQPEPNPYRLIRIFINGEEWIKRL